MRLIMFEIGILRYICLTTQFTPQIPTLSIESRLTRKEQCLKAGASLPHSFPWVLWHSYWINAVTSRAADTKRNAVAGVAIDGNSKSSEETTIGLGIVNLKFPLGAPLNSTANKIRSYEELVCKGLYVSYQQNIRNANKIA